MVWTLFKKIKNQLTLKVSILITYKSKEDVFTDSRIIGISESQLVHPVML